MQKARRHILRCSDRLQAYGFRNYFTPLLGVLFTFPSQYFFAIGHQGIFRLGGWSLRLPSGFHVSRCTLDTTVGLQVSYTRLSLSLACFPKTILLPYLHHMMQSTTPKYMYLGLACFPFVRHYLGNRCFFLFLLLLRCFSSERSLRTAIDSLYAN